MWDAEQKEGPNPTKLCLVKCDFPQFLRFLSEIAFSLSIIALFYHTLLCLKRSPLSLSISLNRAAVISVV